ncbi:hypothetical protein COY93_03650 [Candidatus Uhrbacteria bacterium CG_4_10_14_0_8_um_filter_58_22]|uniref:Uncharacterized protein n=1 Tax=Candidatus Uhrbacteria bacterium CG_4_10_14_0_8_um_filter_58_22 TaxID=1975029 RepID=A0A2M7QAD2_9BACT|nr:MAG: hypothetical protein AUJ19_02625 [Parcubacteria group bacterium CG1_02_58_44]PIY62184.1 MAG: hypothetical protein COY93_03650 [Candidatus Uhrbacteria bacterium CG_4_10_14_0_8_um_filter_58_22]
MRNSINRAVRTATVTAILLLGPALPALADTGLGVTGGISGHSEVSSDLATIIGGLIGGLLSIVGVIFFLLMIYAGVIWMTSSGKEEQVTKARNMIFGAIIGLAVIFAAYGISVFVIQTISPSDTGSGGDPAAADDEGGDVVNGVDPLEASMGGESDTSEDFDALLDELAE